MKVLHALIAPLFISGAVMAAQASPSASPTVQSALQPAVLKIGEAVGGLRIDKWKLAGDVKDEMNSYVASIQKDVNETLPGLVSDADAKPGLIGPVLSVQENADALYSVLLRVAATSEVAAPKEQAAALNQAAIQLRDARKALDQRVRDHAQTQAQTVADLQGQLKKANDDLAAAKAAAVPPPAPAKKKSKKKSVSK